MQGKINRQYYRAKYFAEVKAYAYLDGSQDKKNAKQMDMIIVNLSIDGVGVLTKEEVKEGTILTFIIYMGGVGHELMGYSTFCIQFGELYRVGIKLVTPDNLFTSLLLDYINQEKELSQ